jgi:Zn-dependent metalloprotease
VVKSLQGIPTGDSARYNQTGDKYLSFIGAPRDISFRASSVLKSDSPEVAARAYFNENIKAFGSGTSRQGFATLDVIPDGDRSLVKLQQVYDGIPVFGAEVSIQVGSDGGVISLLSDIMRDTRLLDQGLVPTTPTISKTTARQKAIAAARTLFPDAATLVVLNEPLLYVYHPSVIGDSGRTRLVWSCVVVSPVTMEVEQQVLIDAVTGATVLQYTLTETAKHRHIHDAYGVSESDYFGYMRRQEGQGPTQVKDADDAYDFLGDTYDFFLEHHNRDSIDGGGMDLNATVRQDILTKQNAAWYPNFNWMFFGSGFVVDDVAGHELTHGVTSYTSDLVYAFESGAINESLSDIWGEFIDLTNGKGVDTDAVRWVIGEELYGGTGNPAGIRDMRNPEKFNDPDRYSKYLHYPEWYDNGGVHFNSGIGNKLAYLLTDGDIFNNYKILPMGLDKTAALFYRAETRLLLRSSDYKDLALILVQAAYDLGWNRFEILNVKRATQAVEIRPPDPPHPIQHLRAIPSAGKAVVKLTWSNPNNVVLPTITLVRRTDRFPEGELDIQADNKWVKTTTEESLTDNQVTPGQQYFYGAFVVVKTVPQADYARVVVGNAEANYLSESFMKVRGNAPDLAYSQLTFDPVVDLNKADASGVPASYVNYDNYVVTVKKNISALPVSPDAAIYVHLLEDAYFTYSPRAPIPFFGSDNYSLALAPNGYVAAADDIFDAANEAAMDEHLYSSSESHFGFPKVSYLFANLSPSSGGVVWMTDMEDRFVITYEHVPSFGSNRGNTVQLELFYGGRIRMTWLEVNVEDAIVGISDGNGVPFQEGTDLVKESNLSEMPLSQPGSVILEPVAPVFVDELSPIQFSMFANAPAGADPVFTISKLPVGEHDTTDLPAGVVVSPQSGSSARTATFGWTPKLADGRAYTFRATFTQGTKVASQDIHVYIDNTNVPPILKQTPVIQPANPQDSEDLHVVYNYDQVEAAAEGATVIRWLKNGVLVPGMTNRLEVPYQFTLPKEKWRAIVTPVTYSGLAGNNYQTAEVTIGPDTQPDINKDGKINAIDVQLVVNGALGRLTRTLNADVNSDYATDAVDVQLLINSVLRPSR